MAIKVFITGGTIDGLDYEKESNASRGKKSVIPALLKQSRVSADYSVEMLLMKDSKFINEQDRALLLKKCRACREKRILITHGSMTMAATAKYLGKKRLGKTIVLVGSIIPAAKPRSDAQFNLGFAFAAAQSLPTGVYVAMNGRIFRAANVRKNLRTGYFEKEK